MKFGLLSSLLVTGMLVCSIAQAEPSNWRSVDVKELDIASVKLGMSHEQAIAAMAKHYKLSSSEAKQLKSATIYAYNQITKSKLPSNVKFQKGNTTLQASFSLRFPLNKSTPVAVTRVHYSIPNTKENAAMLKESALAKYGQPSDNRRQATLKWCADYNRITDCQTSKPYLSLVLGSLSLVDPTLKAKEMKYRMNSLKAKPNI